MAQALERLPAKAIECLVLSSVKTRLGGRAWLADQIARADLADAPMDDVLQAADAQHLMIAADDRDATAQSLGGLIDRIEARRDRLRIRLNMHALSGQGEGQSPVMARFEAPFNKRRNGSSRPIVIVPEDAPQPDPDLIPLVADVRRWVCKRLDGKSLTIQQITERKGLRSESVSRILPLAWLAPDISTAILEGRQPPDLTTKSLRAPPDLPQSWEEQR